MKWLLWSRKTQNALVIIPEEAEELIAVLLAIPSSSTHLLLYAAPVTKRMLHFNRLDYYSLPSLPADWTPPPWLPFELGILAGRLYFDFSEYNLLLDSFNLNPEGESGHQSGDGSNSTTGSAEQTRARNFLRFVQDWLALRRQGQDISHTPMGYVCQGWKLRSDHPFFSTKIADEVSGHSRVFHSEYDTVQGDDQEDYGSCGSEDEIEGIDDGEDEELEKDLKEYGSEEN